MACANLQQNMDVPSIANSSAAPNRGNHLPDGGSEVGTSGHKGDDNHLEIKIPSPDTADSDELSLESQDGKLDGQVRRRSAETVASTTSDKSTDDFSNSGSFESAEAARTLNMSDFHLQIPGDVQVFIPSDVQQKLNRVLDTARQRLATAKADLEDVIARLNQETALRQFLTTKVGSRLYCSHNYLPFLIIARENNDLL